jgi:UDP-N-acetylmuramyl pentapeptide synthase
MQTYQIGSSLVGSSFSDQLEASRTSMMTNALSLPTSVSVVGEPMNAHSVVVFSSQASLHELEMFAAIKREFCESYSFLDVYCDTTIADLSVSRQSAVSTLPMDVNASHCETAQQVLERSIGRNVVVVASDSNIDLCVQACELEGLNVVSTVALCTKRPDLLALQS